jgi:hypothetical protein
LKARGEFPKRRLRNAAELTPSGELACTRIREFGYDLGYDFNELEHGWIAEASRQLGLNERTGWAILRGEQLTVSTATVDVISLHTGIPVRVFYDRDC